ncbi:MAG TPA: hypothetical protein VK963_01080 [Candidatus Saccharimonadales bacterium]|nr:hypothetical protein [Candidatus Saccharimonadales bacterium]
MKQVLAQLMRAQVFLVALAVVALVGYTAYQISLIFAVFPDAAAVEAQQKQSQASVIRFNPKAIEAVKRQTAIEAETSLSGLGKPDPFSP